MEEIVNNVTELVVGSNLTYAASITTEVTTTENYELEFQRFYDKMKHMYHATSGVSVFIICLIGMVTNALNIIALSQIIKKVKLPVYRCFLGLAVADFMVVFCLAIKSGTHYLVWSNVIVSGEDLDSASAAFINLSALLPHFTNIAFAASNWCVATMSTLRFIAVFAPLWYQSKCTTMVVNTIIAGVYFCSIIINIPSFMGTRYDSSTRTFYWIKDEVHFKNKGFSPSVVTMFALHIVPMIIIIVLLIPLLWKLCSSAPIERSASNAQYRSRDKLQSSITLVCISTFFVICVLPTVIHFSIKYLSKPPELDGAVAHYKWIYEEARFTAAAQLLLAINYTANFFFYVLLNARLRRMVKMLVGCDKGGKREQHRVACITQQSSLSATGEGGIGEHSTAMDSKWTANGRNGRSMDRGPHRRQRMEAKRPLSTSTLRSRLSADTIQLPKTTKNTNKADNIVLSIIADESCAEREQLLSADTTSLPEDSSSNGLMSSPTEHNFLNGLSTSPAKRNSSNDNNDGVNKNSNNKNDRKKSELSASVSADATIISSNSCDIDIYAPIATVDTMNDLEKGCT